MIHRFMDIVGQSLRPRPRSLAFASTLALPTLLDQTEASLALGRSLSLYALAFYRSISVTLSVLTSHSTADVV